jgi:hypothetical protein
MSTYNFCERLKNGFGKYYDDVSIEKIDGVTMPVHYTGTDFISLHPKDNTCEVSYIRETIPANIQMRDLGGCEKTPYMTNQYRFINWSNKPFNTFAKMQRFIAAMAGLNISVNSVDNDITRIYNEETGRGKQIKIKGMSYIAINFTITSKVDTCNIIEC